MSISAISGSSSLDMSELLGQSQAAAMTSTDIAQSIVDQDDSDGDGLLSLEETPLDSDRFNSMDTDGDGYLTADELAASADQNQQVSGMSGASGTSDSESEEEEEEYDEYDLNEDGVVTLDELLQAFQQGDESLSSIFDSMDTSAISTLTQRLAMQAYDTQASAVEA